MPNVPNSSTHDGNTTAIEQEIMTLIEPSAIDEPGTSISASDQNNKKVDEKSEFTSKYLRVSDLVPIANSILYESRQTVALLSAL